MQRGNKAPRIDYGDNLEASFDQEAPPDATPGESRNMDCEVLTTEGTSCTRSTRTERSSVTDSNLLTGKAIYGSSLLPTLGNSVLTRLRVKCGSREYPDQRQSLMNMLMGENATQRTMFAGRMLAPAGQRTYHHQVFRHNYTSNDVTPAAGSTWPTAFRARVLQPQPYDFTASETDWFYPARSPSGEANGTLCPPCRDTSFRDMSKGYVYYSDTNRS